MAPGSAAVATQRFVFSSSSWLKGLLPACALPAPVLQRQMVFPSLGKQCRNFNSLLCARTAPKPGALKFRLVVQTDSSAKSAFETGKLSSRLNSAKFLLKATSVQWRGFSATASAANQLGMGKGEASQEREHGLQQVPSVGEDWALRLANENGFLSWCRNCYLTTVVGIAMMAEGMTPLAMQAAEGAFFVAGLNVTWGTYQYAYNLLRLRRRTGMSAVGSLLYISMALLHLGLWFVACTLFLGYTDDADSRPATAGDRRQATQQGEDV